jgi:phosphinothricin acetyltransferase
MPDAPARIRVALPADAAAISAVYAPYITDAVASFEEAVPDEAEMRRRMAAEPCLPWLVATRDGEVAGYAYGSRHHARASYRWAVDVSVYLRSSEYRRGTGRALYEVLLPQLRALGYVTAHAGITLPNPGSVGLHEALGFRPVGVYRNVGYKHGAWHDVGWWQLPLTEPPAHPAEPAPWAGVLGP